jgi:hypothetical protein
MQDSEPPTWGQIKKLMDMVTMVTGSLSIAGNPTATFLVALVIITIQVGVFQGDEHWTFMLGPPMIHTIIWQSHPVAIFTNDTVHIRGHSSGHLVSQYSDYNFTGISSSLPTCMSFNRFNATEPYNATRMPHLPWCSLHEVTWKSWVVPWRECLFHVFMFNLSGNEVVCFSKNGTQESNNTGFWH